MSSLSDHCALNTTLSQFSCFCRTNKQHYFTEKKHSRLDDMARWGEIFNTLYNTLPQSKMLKKKHRTFFSISPHISRHSLALWLLKEKTLSNFYPSLNRCVLCVFSLLVDLTRIINLKKHFFYLFITIFFSPYKLERASQNSSLL